MEIDVSEGQLIFKAAQGCVLLKEILAEQIAALADAGVTDWFSGMAQGVDLWAAELVLTLRKKNPAGTPQAQSG